MLACHSRQHDERMRCKYSKDSSSASSSISAENASYSNTTIVAKVTAVNGNTITADIGELAEMSRPDGNAGGESNASAPEKPENDNANSQSSGSDSKMGTPRKSRKTAAQIRNHPEVTAKWALLRKETAAEICLQ